MSVAAAVHLVKAVSRPAINLTTAGVGGPIVSVAEDASAFTLCVIAGAGVRASQVTVDAHNDFEPVPGSPLGLITGVFTQWDGLWYLEIVRSGYPRSIPPDITYFQLRRAPPSSRSTR